jgi:hypothetical protein
MKQNDHIANPPPLNVASPWAAWPVAADTQSITELMDSQFALGLERAGLDYIYSWQQKRLVELVDWLDTFLAWQRWIGSDAPGRTFDTLPIQKRRDYRQMVEHMGIDSMPNLPQGHGESIKRFTAGTLGPAQALWWSARSERIARAVRVADHERHGRDLRRRFVALEPGVDTSPAEHAQGLVDEQPGYVVAHPEWMSRVIEAFEDGSVSQPPRIEQLSLRGAPVDEALRQRARACFGASMRDAYDCAEIGPLALQCPSGQPYHHVAVANAFVEVVRSDGSNAEEGELGRVVATGLHQFASPALRLDLEDQAAWHPVCPACGAQVPTLSHLVGRKQFLLRRPGLPPQVVRLGARHWLPCAPLVEQRLLQTGPNDLRAEVVPQRALTAAEQAAIAAMLRRELGADLQIDVVELPRIDWPGAALGRPRHAFESLLVDDSVWAARKGAAKQSPIQVSKGGAA